MTRDPTDGAMERNDTLDALLFAYGLTDVRVMPGEAAPAGGEAPPLPDAQWKGFHSARNKFLTLLAQQASERRLRAAHGEF